MSTASATKITYQGREVRVIARDSDPQARWWIVFVDDPDRDAFVLPSELVYA